MCAWATKCCSACLCVCLCAAHFYLFISFVQKAQTRWFILNTRSAVGGNCDWFCMRILLTHTHAQHTHMCTQLQSRLFVKLTEKRHRRCRRRRRRHPIRCRVFPFPVPLPPVLVYVSSAGCVQMRKQTTTNTTPQKRLLSISMCVSVSVSAIACHFCLLSPSLSPSLSLFGALSLCSVCCCWLCLFYWFPFANFFSFPFNYSLLVARRAV